MPITYYLCEKCRKSYDSYKDAKRCEAAHLLPASVKAVRYTIEAYPFTVEVTFNDGSKRIYAAEDLGGGLDYYNRRE